MAFGSQEILIIALVVLLLFGATAIPKLARSLGKAQGEFQKARTDFDRELQAGREGGETVQDAQIRQTARDLGIEEKGKSIDDVKAAINQKLA